MEDDKKFDIGQTYDISGVEIFASGTWNGDSYSVDDIDQMVYGFEKTKENLKPYLKLGHDKNQKLLQIDGYPAAGYLNKVYRLGNKLVADFVKVPKAIYELIKSGGYRRVSSEIYVNMSIGGTVYPYLLKAVSLLGGDTPAVQNLKDILALYASEGGAVVYEKTDPFKVYEMESKKIQEDVMEKEIELLNARLAEANKKFSDAQLKIQELEDLNSKLKEFEDKLSKEIKRSDDLEKELTESKEKVKKFSDEKDMAEINSSLDKLIRDGKIFPSQRDAAFHLIKSSRENSNREKKFTIEGKEFNQEDLILKFIENNDGVLNTQEFSRQTSPHGKNGKSAADIIDQKAKEFMVKHPGKSYREALEAVSPEGIPNSESSVME